MTVAKGRCTSDPKPVARAAGKSPRIGTSEAIRPDRSRSVRPRMMASSTEAPSRRYLLTPLNIRIAIHDGDAEERGEADARRDIEVHVAEVQGHGAAGEGEGDRQQQDERRPKRPISHDEYEEDDRDGRGDQDQEVLIGAFEVLKHPQPLDAIAGGKGDLAVESLLCFPDEAALVAADDVAANGHAATAVAAGNQGLAVAHADAGHLGQRNGNAIAGVHGQAADRLGRLAGLLVEAGHDVEPPFPFVKRC